MHRRRFFLLLGTGCVTALLLGLNQYSRPKSDAKATLLISAAASLKDALGTLEPSFEQEHRLVQLNYNFAGSGTLQRQIEQGAPADVFISAASQQMDALQQKGLILAGSRHALLSNQLVLIVPSQSGLALTRFQDLTKAEVSRIAMADSSSVPAGQYAKALLQNLHLFETLKHKFVLGNSVRSVLAAVESGNADAGIVYETDARISKRVKVAAIAPARQYPPIIYPGAVLKRSQSSEVALAYLQFLSSDRARAVFKKYGFGVVR